jgi:hypothetical protein
MGNEDYHPLSGLSSISFRPNVTGHGCAFLDAGCRVWGNRVDENGDENGSRVTQAPICVSFPVLVAVLVIRCAKQVAGVPVYRHSGPVAVVWQLRLIWQQDVFSDPAGCICA